MELNKLVKVAEKLKGEGFAGYENDHDPETHVKTQSKDHARTGSAQQAQYNGTEGKSESKEKPLKQLTDGELTEVEKLKALTMELTKMRSDKWDKDEKDELDRYFGNSPDAEDEHNDARGDDSVEEKDDDMVEPSGKRITREEWEKQGKNIQNEARLQARDTTLPLGHRARGTAMDEKVGQELGTVPRSRVQGTERRTGKKLVSPHGKHVANRQIDDHMTDLITGKRDPKDISVDELKDRAIGTAHALTYEQENAEKWKSFSKAINIVKRRGRRRTRIPQVIEKDALKPVEGQGKMKPRSGRKPDGREKPDYLESQQPYGFGKLGRKEPQTSRQQADDSTQNRVGMYSAEDPRDGTIARVQWSPREAGEDTMAGDKLMNQHKPVATGHASSGNAWRKEEEVPLSMYDHETADQIKEEDYDKEGKYSQHKLRKVPRTGKPSKDLKHEPIGQSRDNRRSDIGRMERASYGLEQTDETYDQEEERRRGAKRPSTGKAPKDIKASKFKKKLKALKILKDALRGETVPEQLARPKRQKYGDKRFARQAGGDWHKQQLNAKRYTRDGGDNYRLEQHPRSGSKRKWDKLHPQSGEKYEGIVDHTGKPVLVGDKKRDQRGAHQGRNMRGRQRDPNEQKTTGAKDFAQAGHRSATHDRQLNHGFISGESRSATQPDEETLKRQTQAKEHGKIEGREKPPKEDISELRRRAQILSQRSPQTNLRTTPRGGWKIQC